MFSDPAFWTAIAFVIFVLAVGKKMWSAASTGLDARSARIRGQLDEAQRLREEAQHLLAEYQRKQRDAINEAEGILGHAREEADRVGVQATENLEAAVARREQQALDRIAQAETQAIDEVRGVAVDLAVAAAGRLIADNLDEARAGALIDASIAELGDRLN